MSKKTDPEPPAKPRRGRCCLFLLGLVVLGLITALWVAGRYADTAVKEGITTFGPDLTGTKVTLQSAHCQLLQGAGKITALAVASPQGFDQSALLTIEEAAVDLALSALLKGTVRVETLRVDGVTLQSESGPAGNNLGLVLANLRTAAGATSDSSDQSLPAIELCQMQNIALILSTTGASPDRRKVTIRISELTGSLVTGEFSLTGLVISNPDGYTSETALTITAVTIKLQPETLMADTLVVDEVIVDGGQALYETSVAGSNFTALQREIEAFEQAIGSGNQETQGVHIKHLYLRNMKGQLSPSLLRHVGVKPAIPIPETHLKDLQSDSGAGILALATEILVQPLNETGTTMVDGLGKVGKTVQETGRTVIREAGEGTKTLLNKLRLPFGRKTTVEKEPEDGIIIGPE